MAINGINHNTGSASDSYFRTLEKIITDLANANTSLTQQVNALKNARK